jgi:two-component system phosphate regulon sensor histidine kinase PhoR
MTEPTPLNQSADDIHEQISLFYDGQAFLHNITYRIAAGGPPDELIPDLAEIVRRDTGADGVRIMLLEDSPLAGSAVGAAAPELIALGTYLMELASSRSLTEYSDLTIPGALPKSAAALAGNLGALVTFPLQAHGTFLGALSLGYYAARQLSASERADLAIAAGQIASAVGWMTTLDSVRRERDYLEQVITSVSDPLIVVDAEAYITLVNPAASRALGVSAEMAVDRRADDVLANADLLLSLLFGETAAAEHTEWLNAEGSAFNPRITELRGDSGAVMGRVLMLRDVTHYRRQREIQKDFDREITHDLKTQLTSLKGRSELVPIVGPLTDKQRSHMDKVYAGIQRLTDMVNKLLDAGRLDPGSTWRLNRQPCDMHALVAETVGMHLVPAESAGLTLTTDLDDDIPVLSLDGELLKRALDCLVDNAIKYAAVPNGIITIRAMMRDDALLLGVQDTGPGIPREKLGLLFERYKRLELPRHKSITGSGLGLYIVRRIAERHDGGAWVESTPGTGSTFWISIPAEGVNLIGGREI